MDPNRKDKVRELYSRIDQLERRLVTAGRKGKICVSPTIRASSF
jgi:hypothetical protein